MATHTYLRKSQGEWRMSINEGEFPNIHLRSGGFFYLALKLFGRVYRFVRMWGKYGK
jgi:hypothetical protein